MFSQPMAMCLLIALTASLMVLGRELCRLINPRKLSTRRIELVFAILGVFAAGVLAVDWIDESHFIFNVTTRLIAGAAGLCGFLTVVLLAVLKINNQERVSIVGLNLFLPIFFLVFSGMAVVAYARFSVRSNPHFSFIAGEFSIGQVEKDDYWFGETDRGTMIPLFHFDTDDQEFKSFAETFQGRFPNFTNSIISRKSADKEANCHGWVFTGGKFLIRGESVERILEDNGYRIVTEPAAGDIIIYRSVAGNILHTALVQAVLNDGTVLAESKWGIDQRFIHLPEHQPYANDYIYYRTNRRDHRIQVKHASEQENETNLVD